jgi:hypothetical protein
VKQRKEEAEVIVRLDFAEQKAHVCVSSWAGMDRKMSRLYGAALPKSGQQVRYWAIPLKAVSFRSLTSLGKARGGGGFAKKARGAAQSSESIGEAR